MQLKSSSLKRNMIIVVASIFLSLLALAYQQPINPDGRLYLWSAQAFLDQGLWQNFSGGLHAALQIYPWPFYSLCIALISRITHLSVLNAAHLLSIVLLTVVALTFVRLVKELDPRRVTLNFAALTILISHYLNHYRGEALRGDGYMAFGLLAVLFFIRFLKYYRLRDGMLWMVWMFIATAFRIEGAILILFAPWIVWLAPQKAFLFKLKAFLKTYVLFILFIGGILVWLSISPNHHFSHLGRLPDFTTRATLTFHSIYQYSLERYDQIVSIVIKDKTAHFLGVCVLLFLYIGILGQAILMVLGLPFFLLACHGFALNYRRLTWPLKGALFSFITLIIATLLMHLGVEWFVSARFTELLSLLFMLFIPISLRTVWENWRGKQTVWYGKTWGFTLVVLSLSYTTITGLGHFGPSKTYIIEAAQWTATHLPKETIILNNDWQFMFYTHKPDMTIYTPKDFCKALYEGQANHYDLIAIRIPRKQKALLDQYQHLIGASYDLSFKNKRGDGVYLFCLKNKSICTDAKKTSPP